MSQIYKDSAADLAGVLTLTGNSGGAVGPSAGNINVVGTGSVAVTGNPGTNTLTISVAGEGVVWTDEAAAFNAATNNGYFVTGVTTGTLPASPSQGDTIEFIADSTSALTIQANTGQVIRFGSAVSAAAGVAVNNARGDSVSLVYRTSGTAWIAKSIVGTWSLT